MWKCPRCGREYVKDNQWHSCGATTTDDYLAGKPETLKEIYRLLERNLRKSGVRFDVAKTAVSLWKVHNFATLYVQKRAIKVEFLSRKPVEDPRIVSRHEVKGGLYFTRMKLTSMGDVDETLLTWLKGID